MIQYSKLCTEYIIVWKQLINKRNYIGLFETFGYICIVFIMDDAQH